MCPGGAAGIPCAASQPWHCCWVRWDRAARGALLLWGHCAVIPNAMRGCQRSRSPSLAAGSVQVLLLLQLFSPKLSGERKRLCPVLQIPLLTQHPNFPLFGCMAQLALSQWATLKGLELSPGKRQPCTHRSRADAPEIRILIKLLSFYFKNQNSSNGFHFPPTENRILRKICNLSLKILVPITSISTLGITSMTTPRNQPNKAKGGKSHLSCPAPN